MGRYFRRNDPSCTFYPKYYALSSITEFDYSMGQVRNSLIIKDPAHQMSLLRWVASHIVEHSLEPTSDIIHMEPIVKVSLSFPQIFGGQLLDPASGLL